LRRLTGRPADPPDAPKAIAVEPKVLDRYVGPYVSVAGLFTIARKDDRLYAQLTGQPAARIYPESPTRFFWKGVDARVDFVRGAENRVVKLVLHQNGKDLTAWRLRPGGAPEAGGAAEE
jgi:hypothetical protein